jgi:hypothetical protein
MAAIDIVIVRGLNRFLELKQISEKQKEDKAKREDEAFRVKHAEKYRIGNVTVTKPFSFRTNQSRKGYNRENLIRNARRAEKALCTLKPETIAQKQRQLIDKILNNSDEGE